MYPVIGGCGRRAEGDRKPCNPKPQTPAPDSSELGIRLSLPKGSPLHASGAVSSWANWELHAHLMTTPDGK
jgi:hypothetical protein